MGKTGTGRLAGPAAWRNLAAMLLVSFVLPARGANLSPYVYFVTSDASRRLVAWQNCQDWPPDQRQAGVPCALRLSVTPPPEPVIPPYPPYRIEPSLSVDDRVTMRTIAEGLRVSPTGRILYGFLRRRFGPFSGSDRTLTLSMANMGENGDLAVTSGRPPTYVITLNRDLLRGAGPAAMVAKLGHEIVHVHDYVAGVQRSVSMEVSAHAADAAIAYEANMATTGKPDGPFSKLISLPDVYEAQYVPFRTRPSPAAHGGYWQHLMAFVLEQRPYNRLYRDSQGQTIWNSPPGPVSAETYVPYDPAYGWPEDGP